MTRKPSGIFETRPAQLERCRILISGVPLHEAPSRLIQPNWFWRLSDFPEKPVFFKRSDFVAAQMPPSNDAKEVPPDAPALLMRCLEQFLKARTFDPETYRSGELHGSDQPHLAKALMFVAIDDPVRGAARYANGDWSDIGRILPMLDRFV